MDRRDFVKNTGFALGTFPLLSSSSKRDEQRPKEESKDLLRQKHLKDSLDSSKPTPASSFRADYFYFYDDENIVKIFTWSPISVEKVDEIAIWPDDEIIYENKRTKTSIIRFGGAIRIVHKVVDSDYHKDDCSQDVKLTYPFYPKTRRFGSLTSWDNLRDIIDYFHFEPMCVGQDFVFGKFVVPSIKSTSHLVFYV